MSKNTVKKIVKKYLSALRAHNIPFLEAYLFGSYARGASHDASDIDVAIVAKEASSERALLKKSMRLRELSLDVDLRIEPILLQKSEFKRGQESILAGEVKRGGIRIE